jgi:hypothetical protein
VLDGTQVDGSAAGDDSRQRANFNIDRAGYFIVCICVVTWIATLANWRFGHVEARWEQSAAPARDTGELDLAPEVSR